MADLPGLKPKRIQDDPQSPFCRPTGSEGRRILLWIAVENIGDPVNPDVSDRRKRAADDGVFYENDEVPTTTINWGDELAEANRNGLRL